VQPGAKPGAELVRLGCERAALLLAPAARLQPREPGQAKGQLGLLTAFPGQVDRF
jgi:hypothetical protein